MPLWKEQLHTIEDIYNLSDGERAELIDGQIYYMALPMRKHQKLVMELSTIINSYIKSKGGLCEVYPAPFAVFLNNNDYNYVEPEKNNVKVYNFESEETVDYTCADSVKVGIYEDLTIDFSAISPEENYK